MRNRASIKELFIFGFCIKIFFLILILGVLFFIAFSFDSFIETFNTSGIFLYTLIIIFLLISIGFCVKEIVPYFKDLKYVRNKSYLEIEGVVKGFEKNSDPESGVQVNTFAIIKYGDNEEIVLKVNDILERNKNYLFLYLPNTKIAKVTKRIS